MLKLLMICSAAVVPTLILPAISDDNAGIYEPKAPSTSFNSHIEKIGNCEPIALDIHFHNIYVEMHSADYLETAIGSSAHCKFAKAKIVGFKHDASTDNDISLTRVRVKEVESYMEAYSVEYESQSDLEHVPTNTALLNGLSVKVHFSFYNSSNTNS